jgi:LemA protein
MADILDGLLTFAAIALAAVWLVVSYNQLVALKHRVARTWGNIDSLLRQRHDVLSRLLELFDEHSAHAEQMVQRAQDARGAVFAARHAQDPAALGRAEAELRERLAELVAIGESNSQLHANPSFTALRTQLAALETELEKRREDYNDAVGENNVAVEQFPGRLIAGIGGFKPHAPLHIGSH